MKKEARNCELGIGKELCAFAAFLYQLASLQVAWVGSLF